MNSGVRPSFIARSTSAPLSSTAAPRRRGLFLAGDVQRRVSVPRRPVDLRAFLQQQPRRLDVAIPAGAASTVVRLLDLRAVVQQQRRRRGRCSQATYSGVRRPRLCRPRRRGPAATAPSLPAAHAGRLGLSFCAAAMSSRTPPVGATAENGMNPDVTVSAFSASHVVVQIDCFRRLALP